MSDGARPEPPSLLPDVALFLGGGCLVAGVVGWGVPALSAAGVDPMAAWMLLALPLVFAPILVGGSRILRGERRSQHWIDRLRLRRPSSADWRWGWLGLLGIALGSAAAFRSCFLLGLDPNPPFSRHVQPLVGPRLWMLGLWTVYWPINILGEELVWRGISLPRMQARLGERAWLAAFLHAGLSGPGFVALALGLV
jgi:membrane protease YdiL (CAAX protease family)